MLGPPPAWGLAGSAAGIGYGLGFLRFDRQFPNDGSGRQLTWVAWFAALAVIGGAAAGAWAACHRGLDLRLGGKVALVAAAGLGASVVTPLTLLPASSATVLMRERPVLATALTALLGVVVGVAAAATALSVRLVAVSLTLLVAVVWLLALVSALPALLPGADPPDARLAVLDLSVTGGGSGSTVAIVTIPVVSLLVCGGVAAAALPRAATAVHRGGEHGGPGIAGALLRDRYARHRRPGGTDLAVRGLSDRGRGRAADVAADRGGAAAVAPECRCGLRRHGHHQLPGGYARRTLAGTARGRAASLSGGGYPGLLRRPHRTLDDAGAGTLRRVAARVAGVEYGREFRAGCGVRNGVRNRAAEHLRATGQVGARAGRAVRAVRSG